MKFPFIFQKKTKLPTDAIVNENWKTAFGMFDQKRFTVEDKGTYASIMDKGQLTLEIRKKNHFAWVLSELYRYSDFALEAETGFGADTAYSALGFIFRYVNEENFYYFLVSNKGYFRFDVVFNNNPMPRIEWTKSPLISPEDNSIRIIAHDNHFSFYVDDEWIAEIEDDTLASGQVGFTGQNYGDAESSALVLKSFSIESRGIEVEKQFERWVNIVPQEPEYRIELAKTLFAMSEFAPAAVQMKKALRSKKPDANDYFLFGEISLNLGMFDLALKNIDKSLELDPTRIDAIREKANILYLQNDFLRARDYLVSVINTFERNATVWNLLGNCEYAVGNWQKACEAYEKADSIQPEMPFFKLNAARSLEKLGKKKEAVVSYIAASRLFFKQEAFDELYAVFSQVRKLDPDNKDVLALEGEILYFDNKLEEAEKILLDLEQKEYSDSSVYYLLGLIRVSRKERENALAYFKKACALEPSFHLYWLKAAECESILGLDSEENLGKAYALAPGDPWVLNQMGQSALANNKIEDAKKYFSDAYKKAPAEVDILINLSECYARSGEKLKAFSILDRGELADNPKIRNHKGNLFSREGDQVQAQAEYEKALRLDPGNPVYLENCAKSALELDMIMRAEELLLELFDVSPTPPVYNLIGYLALIKREWVRAEIAFREGLTIDPENSEIKCNLASLYIDRNDYAKAKQFIAEVLDKDPENNKALRMQERLKTSFEVRFACASCGREWWAPKNIPPQGALKLVGEPPADAPAGKCGKCGKIYCVSCAEAHIKDSRFTCPDCNELLKLNDDWLKYILMEKINSRR